MPRSRSRSFESMTRSCTCSCAAKVPDCCSSLSTSVVLPWSTWAMIAMLRRVRFIGPRIVRESDPPERLQSAISWVKFALPEYRKPTRDHLHGHRIAIQDRGRDGREGQRPARRRRVERHLRDALQIGRRRVHRGEPPHLPRPALHHAGRRAIPVGRDPVRRDAAPEDQRRRAVRRVPQEEGHPPRHQGRCRREEPAALARREGDRRPRRPAQAPGGVLQARRALRQVARGDHHRQGHPDARLHLRQRARARALRRRVPGGLDRADHRARSAARRRPYRSSAARK